MKVVFYISIICLCSSACNPLFDIDKTTHSLIIQNKSDIDFDFRWSHKGLINITTIEATGTNVSSSTQFLTQSGNQNELELNDFYDHFDELILIIETNDGSKQEIGLKSLQIEPFVKSDGFMSTQEWHYIFDVTNENLD